VIVKDDVLVVKKGFIMIEVEIVDLVENDVMLVIIQVIVESVSLGLNLLMDSVVRMDVKSVLLLSVGDVSLDMKLLIKNAVRLNATAIAVYARMQKYVLSVNQLTMNP
jgi:hypothetical protein